MRSHKEFTSEYRSSSSMYRDMNLQNTFSSERLKILKPRHIFNVAGLKSLTP